LAKPLVGDVIAATSLSAQGFQAGYGATLTLCERGHQDLGRRHGCRYFARSCSPAPGSPTAWRTLTRREWSDWGRAVLTIRVVGQYQSPELADLRAATCANGAYLDRTESAIS
jgi:hypothetical protein